MESSGSMGLWQLVLVGLVMLGGLVGSAFPAVHGPLVVWAAVFWWAMTERGPQTWWMLMGATAMLLLSVALRLLPARRGGRRVRGRALLTAVCGGIAGFFAVPVVGVVPGFLLGLYARARVPLGSHGAAKAATRTAMRSGGRRVLAELTAGLFVTGAWIGLLWWR